MVDVNVDSLDDSEINFFMDRMISLFEKMHNEELSELKELEEIYKGKTPPIITNLKLSTKAKLLFLAKKLAKNVTISVLTGIKPMFLDSDTSVLNSTKGYKYYMETPLKSLAYSTTVRLEKITNDFLLELKSADINKQRQILKKINEYYQVVYDKDIIYRTTDYLGNPYHNGSAITDFLTCMNAKDADMDFREMVLATYRRGVHIGPTTHCIKEIKNIYEEYGEMNKTKGR